MNGTLGFAPDSRRLSGYTVDTRDVDVDGSQFLISHLTSAPIGKNLHISPWPACGPPLGALQATRIVLGD